MIDLKTLENLIAAALAEDIGGGDVTSQLLIPEHLNATMRLVAKEPLIVCGLDVAKAIFKDMHFSAQSTDGARAGADTIVAEIKGPARKLLTLERTALNFMQRMSGVATLTAKYVEAVKSTKAKILDTRKTIPGWRQLDKYAVMCGGGGNHRMGLFDAVMIKDNHIALSGSLTAAMAVARMGKLPVIVECDTLAQVKEAVAAKPDRILLDNMSPAMMKDAVALVGGAIPLEASGGVTLETVRAIAETGVDFISVGSLTHSARAVDLGAEFDASVP